MQFTMEFDEEKLTFQGVDAGSLNITESNFALLNNQLGVITFSISDVTEMNLIEGDILFNVYFESRQEGQLSEMIDISSEVLEAELYTSDSEIKTLDYVFRTTSQAGNEIELFQNQPNPFSEATAIAFYMPSTQHVTLTIFNAEGKQLWKQSNRFNTLSLIHI